jgi:hypothetical protein
MNTSRSRSWIQDKSTVRTTYNLSLGLSNSLTLSIGNEAVQTLLFNSVKFILLGIFHAFY